jgi:hypothetical protein
MIGGDRMSANHHGYASKYADIWRHSLIGIPMT